MRNRNKVKSRLTKRTNRHNITLRTHRSVMPIVRYKGAIIQCATAAEAVEITRALTTGTYESPRTNLIQNVADIARTITSGPWTRQLFWKFIENVGESQTNLLKLLVSKQCLTDEEMRTAVGVD